MHSSSFLRMAFVNSFPSFLALFLCILHIDWSLCVKQLSCPYLSDLMWRPVWMVVNMRLRMLKMWVHIFWGWSTHCCCCALYCLCILIVWLIWVVLKAWSWVPYWWNAWASTQCFSVLELRVPCPNRPDICPVPNACELRAVRPGRTREWSCYQHHNWGCNAKGLWVFFFLSGTFVTWTWHTKFQVCNAHELQYNRHQLVTDESSLLFMSIWEV